MARVALASGQRPGLMYKVDGYRRGTWAAHRSQNGSGWTVSDLMSGRAFPCSMVDDLTELEAVNLASYLAERIGRLPAFDHDTAPMGTTAKEWKCILDACIAESLERIRP